MEGLGEPSFISSCEQCSKSNTMSGGDIDTSTDVLVDDLLLWVLS